MPGNGGGGGGISPVPGNGGGGGGMPGSGGAGGAFIMGDVGVMAAVPEGGSDESGGGARAGAVLCGELEDSGEAQQAVSWEDEIFSLVGGPDVVAGVLEGFDDRAGF